MRAKISRGRFGLPLIALMGLIGRPFDCLWGLNQYGDVFGLLCQRNNGGHQRD